MERLILTNDHSTLSTVKKAGYTDYDEGESGNLRWVVHRKRRFPVQNYKSFPNGDFVASAGTLIYKTKIGEAALVQLYADFNGDVHRIRRSALGSYMIAIKHGSTVYVFVDEYETLQTYYYFERGTYVIANSLSVVAMATSSIGTLKINEFALLEEAFSYAIIGNETCFTKIYKLLGTEIITINTRSGCLQITTHTLFSPRNRISEQRIDELAKEFASRLRTQLSIISDAFTDIRIMSTGGIDSRLLLAGLLSVGVKPGLFYGVGNSILTSTRDEDLEMCKRYAETFDLKLYLMDWRSEDDDITKNWDYLFEQHGFYASTYVGCRAFFDELEIGIPESSELILTGYFGETIKYRPWLGYHSDDEMITVSQFITKSWPHGRGAEVQKAIGIQRYTDLRSHVRRKLLEIGDKAGIERDGEFYSASSLYMLWDSIYTRDADVDTTNLLNHFVCSLLPLASYDLHRKSFEVPLEYRKDDRFALMVIKELDERLLEIPFFSHRRMMKLNRRTFQLRPVSLAHKTSDFLGRLGLQGKAHSVLRKVWLTTMGDAKSAGEDREGSELRKQIESIIYREQKKANIEPFVLAGYPTSNIGALARYAIYLYYINKIINEGAS